MRFSRFKKKKKKKTIIENFKTFFNKIKMNKAIQILILSTFLI